MPKLTLWKGAGVRTKDFKLIDRQVSEQFSIGGTEVWIHKYVGPMTSTTTTTTTTASITAALPLLLILLLQILLLLLLLLLM